MSTDPLFGHDVQAPIVSEPKATPRLIVSHVAPSPMAAASSNVKHDPNSSRTFVPMQRGGLVAARQLGGAVIRRRYGAGVVVFAVERAKRSGRPGLRFERVVGVVEQALDAEQDVGRLAREQRRVRLVG